MTRHPGRLRLVLLSGMLCTAACGSTVQQQTLQSGGAQGGFVADGPGGDGLSRGGSELGGASGPGSTELGGSAGSVSTSGGSVATETARGSASGPVSSGAPGGQPGSAGGSPSAPVAGASSGSGPIRVGFLFSSDQDAAGRSFGIEGLTTGDTRTQYEAIVADLNDQGGILGRPVTLFGYDLSTANQLNNPAEEENRACTAFVEDFKVFVVLGSGVFLSPCLAKSGIASIQGGQFHDATTIDRDLIFDGGGMLVQVLADVFVERLAAQTYFTGWNTATGSPGPAPVKVGLIYQDIPVFKNYYTQIKKALASQGITVDPDDEFLYAPTIDGVTAGSQAAVLRFAGNGVTHVFGAALFFFQAADNQGYRPRYALDSLVPPFLLAQNVGASQLKGSMGVGWRPTQDLAQAQDPGPVSPLAAACTELMRKAGEDVGQRAVVYLSHVRCEQVASLARALEKGGAVTLQALRQGFDTLGSQVPIVSFGERWAPDRHASNDTVADLAYVESCSCYAYSKAPRTRF